MVIETEYNIGDEAYTLYKNKVTKTKEELLKSL